jgi:hypothetical protein
MGSGLLQIILYVIRAVTTWFDFLYSLANISPQMPVMPPHLN